MTMQPPVLPPTGAMQAQLDARIKREQMKKHKVREKKTDGIPPSDRTKDRSRG